MAIEVNVSEPKPQEEKPFPKLMKSKYTGMIVLFHSSAIGMVLDQSKNPIDQVGTYSEEWAMSSFEDFNESVTIKNK